MLNRLLIVWTALCAVLVLLYGATSRSLPPPAPIMPTIAPLPPLPQSERLNKAENVVKRPLLWPSRRPIPTTQITNQTLTIDGTELIGLANNGEQTIAILRKNNEIIRLHIGQTIGDWRFSAPRYNGAAFTRNDETRVIKIPRINLNDFLSSRATPNNTPPSN